MPPTGSPRYPQTIEVVVEDKEVQVRGWRHQQAAFDLLTADRARWDTEQGRAAQG